MTEKQDSDFAWVSFHQLTRQSVFISYLPSLVFFPPTINAHLESESEITHSCPTLCDPMGCSLPGFSVHAIFQARVLEWVAISFSWGSS